MLVDANADRLAQLTDIERRTFFEQVREEPQQMRTIFLPLRLAKLKLSNSPLGQV